MQTAQLILELPSAEAAALQRYAQEHHTTVAGLLVELARRLEPSALRPPHPDILALTGLVPPSVDAEEAHRDHLLARHR